MRLRNLLLMPGGVSEQGRDVTFRLRYRDKAGRPLVRDVSGHMLPISEPEMQAAVEAAQKTEGRALGEGQEYTIRILQASLRDPADLSKLLIEDAADLQALRDGLVAPQYDRLLMQYRAVIEQEYPDPVTDKDVKGMEAQARDFSPGDQRGPG